MNSEIEFVSVTELNRYISYRFSEDAALGQVYLEGEISNFKRSGKHCYLSLKDENSEISAMFFYPANLSLNFIPVDGMSVQVIGRVQVYEKKGTYGIIIQKMIQRGVGLMYQQYLDLKAKLEKEGLFDPSKKLPLPQYPNSVGIITALKGEAINDIVSTFTRRFPLVKLTLFPALVQGADAPKDLIRALKLALSDETLDAIIIGRGGGSFEDLNCFNDEALARLLATSKIPTVSAVGHEGDYTICDFVCSHRAPTPTGGAMALSKDKSDIFTLIDNLTSRLNKATKNELVMCFEQYQKLSNSYGLAHVDEILNQYEKSFTSLENKLKLLSPMNLYTNYQQNLGHLTNQLENALRNTYLSNEQVVDSLSKRIKTTLVLNKIDSLQDNVNQLTSLLQSNYLSIMDKFEVSLNHYLEKIVILNPFNIMKKGYSIVYKDNSVVYSVNDLKNEDKVKIKFKDGSVDASIINIEKE